MANSTAHAVAEAIASRDLNNLYLASSFFADHEKYNAFCAYYALMRVVDDRIDALPTRMGLSDRERCAEHEIVSAWDAGVKSCYQGRTVNVDPRSVRQLLISTQTAPLREDGPNRAFSAGTKKV